MRMLERNKVSFYYALYESKEPVIDEWGNYTGEYEVCHGNPVLFHANVSAAKGETQTRQFGETESYDKVVVMDDSAPPIDEYSILWVDTVPVLKEDGSTDTPHDYVVTKVARSLNGVSVAIEKVYVSE